MLERQSGILTFACQIDTCCIDKTSSAELTESINSMYHWYWEASLCVVYLEDFLEKDYWKRLPPFGKAFEPRTLAKVGAQSLASCAWFKRGWTLQELLAPRHVTFCDLDWDILGTKSALARDLSDITGIDLDALKNRAFIRQSSVARRMSWAAGRKTTRIEDTAYCLLGLFNVNMPLLYGERHKAFTRLQSEIVRVSDDESIFAWAQDRPYSGLFATSPHAFATSRNIVGFKADTKLSQPYQMTNRGLAIYLASDFSDVEPCSICRKPGKRDSAQGAGLGTPDPTISDIVSFVSKYNEGAESTRFLLPYPESCRTVQLASGSITGQPPRLFATAREAQETAKQNPVVITLHKSGAVWQRVECGRFKLRHRAATIQGDKGDGGKKLSTERVDESYPSYELYYIPQLE